MKRFFIALAAFSAVCGWAQESDSEDDYVLRKAREKYSATSVTEETEESDGGTTSTTTVTVEVTRTDDAALADEEPSEYPYTPFIVGFVPGVSYPFAVYDTSICLSAIGAITGSVDGAQAAGVFNIADGFIGGVQAAGVFNIAAGDVRGVQGAGVFNIAEDVDGVQGSGVFNIAGNVDGVQGSGVFNIAEDVDGVQASGVFNIAERMSGVQAAGVFNIADKADGVMIGLVNVADELDGVAIGLINIIGNGIHDLSVDYQPVSGIAYATFRSGTPYLYASFFAGQPTSEFARSPEGLTAGAALGHRFKFLFVTADVELGIEAPIDPDAVHELKSAIDNDVCLGSDFDPWLEPFGTLRASFGFGKRKGFGPYVGIKADFAPAGSGAVPESMRSAFGSSEPYTISLFKTDIDIWPKWFVGVKF